MRVALIGASGGIGAALLKTLAMATDVEHISATYCDGPPVGEQSSRRDTSVTWSQLDASDENAVIAWANELGDIDWLINTAGLLHDGNHRPEKSLQEFDPKFFQQNLDVNCLPTLLLAKHAGPCLRRSKSAIFATLSAKVGSISDNQLGGWVSYRASKAALNMALKCIAIEWQRTQKTTRVLALHPGTTDTPLSAPFQKNVASDKLFSPQKTATLLMTQLREAHAYPSGRFIGYGGHELPW